MGEDWDWQKDGGQKKGGTRTRTRTRTRTDLGGEEVG